MGVYNKMAKQHGSDAFSNQVKDEGAIAQGCFLANDDNFNKSVQKHVESHSRENRRRV